MSDATPKNNEDLNQVMFLPNGKLNYPYLIANANLLLKENEAKTAASIYIQVAKERAYEAMAFYGLGQCFAKLGKPNAAIRSFQKAFTLTRKAYVADAIIECMMISGQYEEAEKLARECAMEFLSQTEIAERFRDHFHKAVSAQYLNRP